MHRSSITARPAMLVGLLMMMSMAPLIATFSEVNSPTSELQEGFVHDAGMNEKLVNIPAWPNGTSDSYRIAVPDGHAVDALTLGVAGHILPRAEELSWEYPADFNDSRADFSNVGFNQTGLTVLPVGFEFDFENNTGSQWTLSGGGWAIGQDSNLGGNRVSGGSNALYTYTGSYPNSLSTTYWATSPSINCGHCSGSWELSFMRRLGVESYYYDHAYVQAKDSNGNWQSVWSHSSSTINEVSFTKQTYTITNQVIGNSDLQIRFGIGTTDGSVTYTGWNIDDIHIQPTSGVQNNLGTWTSPSLGYSDDADVVLNPGPYGLMSLVGVFPTGSHISWSILDADYDTPIPGFSARTDLVSDLGTIDWTEHKHIRFHIEMSEGSGGSPWIKSINMNGRWRSEMIQYVVDDNWELTNCSWFENGGEGIIRGSVEGKASPPKFNLARPTSRIITDINSTGPVALGFYDFEGVWKALPDKGVVNLPTHMSEIQFEFRAESDFWSLSDFVIDLNGGGMVQDLSIDMAHDGVKEWALDDITLGWLGHQNRFANGERSHQMIMQPSISEQIEIVLPQIEVQSFSMDLTPVGTEVKNLEVDVLVDGQVILERDFGTTDKSVMLNFSQEELTNLTMALESAPTTVLSDAFATARMTLSISGTTGVLLARGLSIIQQPELTLEFDSQSALLTALNDEVADKIGSGGIIEVPLTLKMALPGAVKVSIVSINTSHASMTSNLNWANDSITLTPSAVNYEVEAKHLVFNGSMSAVQLDFISPVHRVSFLQQMDGTITQLSGQQGLVFLSSEGGLSNDSGSEVFTDHAFQISRDWNDEPWLDFRIRPVMDTGVRGLSKVEKFGQGPMQGIENDIEVISWSVTNDAGKKVPFDSPYLRSNTWVDVNVNMHFEDLPQQTPRSGEIDVNLYLDGVKKANGTVDSNGTATLSVLVPSSAELIVFTIMVEAGDSQEIFFRVKDNHSFNTDSLAPILLASNIRFYDHRPSSQAQLLEFNIGDVPVLPHAGKLMLWRSWIDDSDSNGIPDAGEHYTMAMQVPTQLNTSEGIYSAHVNDLSGAQGDLVSGYIVMTDAAGNALIGGGGPGWDNHLFLYQIKEDSAPLVHTTSAGHVGGNIAWIHPGEEQHMQFPFDEANGRSDIASVRVELASTVPSSPMAVIWSASTGVCSTSDQYLEILSCGVLSRSGDESPFASDLVFDLEFKIDWTMPVDTSTQREPTIEVLDRAGQGSYSILPHLRWKYSTDLMIDASSISITVGSISQDANGAWVKPGQTASVSAIINWQDSVTLAEQLFDVSGRFNGKNIRSISENGSFTIDVVMPSVSGEHALVLALDNLPTNANDMTDPDDVTIWFVVDATSPSISEVVAPRPGATLSLDSLSNVLVEFRIQEEIKMQQEDLMLNWQVRRIDSNMPLAEGMVEAEFSDSRNSGIAIPAQGLIDLSDILPMETYEDQLVLEVWVSGQDSAGNAFSTFGNSASQAMASWNIQMVEAMFKLSENPSTSVGGMAFVGDDVIIDVQVVNYGLKEGSVDVLIEVVDIDGSRLVILESTVPINYDESELLRADWQVKKTGEFHFVVSLDDVEVGSTDSIIISQSVDEDWLSGSIIGVEPIFIWVFFMLLLALLVVLGLFMKGEGDSGGSVFDEEESGEYVEHAKEHVPLPEDQPWNGAAEQAQEQPVHVEGIAPAVATAAMPYGAIPAQHYDPYSGQTNPHMAGAHASPYAAPPGVGFEYHQ
ncbi:MAG: hypothetical protein HOA04_05620 [Euryarchaeota archaeon]|nr:hypothetical protein [Euryarchaeota archaeon]